MTEPLIHYIFRHSIRERKPDGQFNIKFIEKKFINADPIQARKEAFSFYRNYSHAYGLALEFKQRGELENETLEGIDFDYEGTKIDLEPEDSQSILNDDFKMYPNNLDIDGLEWKAVNPDLKGKETSGPSIFLSKDSSLLMEDDDSEELPIQEYFLGLDDLDPYSVSELMTNLNEEYKIYNEYGYDTADDVISVPFWDPEVYDNGSEGESIFQEYSILRTDFVWWRYSEANWWNDPDFDDEIEHVAASLAPENFMDKVNALLVDRHTIKRKKSNIERIQSGEGVKVEFKPDLFGVDSKNNRNFKFEAAKQ